MLTVENLHVTYGKAMRALHGVSVNVPDGTIVVLLGTNGAGKTTLLRAISGTLRMQRGEVERGSITWHDRPLLGKDPARIVRDGVLQVPEGRRIFGRLTVEENLRAASLTLSKTARTVARERVGELFPMLNQRRGQRAGLLSGGEQQMLAIGRALMTNPQLLLLDEPSLGLAPKITEQIMSTIVEINRQGTSILLVEQNAAVALGIGDHAYVLEVGRVSLSGPAGELSRTEEVARLYMGQGSDEPSEAPEVAPTARRLTRWVDSPWYTAPKGGRS